MRYRPDRRRRLVLLILAAFTLGALGEGGAGAQTAEPTPVEQFGGFTELSRSNGIQVTYDSPGTFPFSPVLQFSVPEALTTLTTGPSGFALASLAFPGHLLANLPAVIEQSGNENPPFLEPYNIKAQANSPAGPFEAEQSQGPVTQRAHAEGVIAEATTAYSGLAASPLVDAGSIVSTSMSTIEGDKAITRTRTEVTDLTLVAGLVTIESVVTDLVAASNAKLADTDGTTVVSGVKVLGLDAVIDADGLRVVEVPPEPDDPTGGPLGGGADPLGGLTDPINDLLAQTDGPRDEALTALLDQSGIEIRLAEPEERVAGGLGERSAGGLIVESTYDGATTPILSALLAAVPSSQLPNDSPPGFPINASPQALVNLMKDTHITSYAIAPGTVSVNATPSFAFDESAIDIPIDVGGDIGSTGGDVGSSSDFATPTPELPESAAGATDAGGVPIGGEPILAVGEALPAFMLIILVLGSPFFAMGSSKLADNTLSAASTSCPEGLDRPDLEGGPQR